MTYDHNYATYTIADPQYNSSGGQVGTTNRVVPIYKRTVAYKAATQAVFDRNLQVTQAFNDLAYQQTGQLQTRIGVPFSLDGLPAHATTPAAQIINDTVTPATPQASVGAADLSAHYETVRAAILSRPLIQFNIDRAARLVQMRNAGILPGMQAYDNEMNIFDFRWTDAQNQAIVGAGQEQSRLFAMDVTKGQFFNQAIDQTFKQLLTSGQFFNQASLQRFEMLRTISDFIETFRARNLQESLVYRNQPMNEISALLHGGQISQPQFEGFRPGKLDNTPVGQYVYQSAALDQQKYQTQVSQSNQLTGGLLGLGGSLLGALSDPALKTDIGEPEAFLDRLNSLNVKSWRYRPEVAAQIGDEGGLHLGPMADEFAAAFGGDGHTISYVRAASVVVTAAHELGVSPIDVFGLALLILKRKSHG